MSGRVRRSKGAAGRSARSAGPRPLRGASLVVLLILSASGVSLAGSRPSNDSFARARSISVPGSARGDFTNASMERREPTKCTDRKSVWFRFTLSERTPILISVAGDDTSPRFGVFQGRSVSKLSLVGCGGAQNKLWEPGTYYIQVGDNDEPLAPPLRGTFKLSVRIGTCAVAAVVGTCAAKGAAGPDACVILGLAAACAEAHPGERVYAIGGAFVGYGPPLFFVSAENSYFADDEGTVKTCAYVLFFGRCVEQGLPP